MGGGGRTSVLCGGLGLVYTCGGRGEDECVVWGLRASLYVGGVGRVCCVGV